MAHAHDEQRSIDGVLDAVGPRLRAIRQHRGTTLAALSAETGISVSTLSRLESGQRRPNLELLLPLAKAHQVPLDDLVGAPQTGDPRVHLKPVQRYGQTIVPLTRRSGGLHAFKSIIHGGDGPQTPETQKSFWQEAASSHVPPFGMLSRSM